MIDQLRFPVLALSQGTVIAHAEPATLMVATKHALRSGYFDNMWLVDATGKAYKVRGYQTISEPFWRRPMTPFGRGVRLRDFVLEESPPASLEDIRKHVISCIEEKPELYDTADGSDQLVRYIRKASSLQEVISVLGVQWPRSGEP